MRGRTILALALLTAPLCGFQVRPLTPTEQALVRHATNNDPAWDTLADAEVMENRDRGLMFARFGPTVSKLKDADFEISGFVTPLDPATRTRHFILTRRDSTCPFCPPNAPTEAVEITLDRPMDLVSGMVRVEGRLQLVTTSDTGLFYRLTDARVTRPPETRGRA